MKIRPVVHSDLPSFCALAARARAEAGSGAAADPLARTFCDVGDVDADRFTWVAVTDDGPRSLPVAVASFWRCEDDVTCARAALAVDSAYRGQGLGELLYGKLAETARTYGIESLRAEVALGQAGDANDLASLGLDVRPLGSHRAELHWVIREGAPQARDLVRLLFLLEGTGADARDGAEHTDVRAWTR